MCVCTCTRTVDGSCAYVALPYTGWRAIGPSSRVPGPFGPLWNLLKSLISGFARDSTRNARYHYPRTSDHLVSGRSQNVLCSESSVLLNRPFWHPSEGPGHCTPTGPTCVIWDPRVSWDTIQLPCTAGTAQREIALQETQRAIFTYALCTCYRRSCARCNNAVPTPQQLAIHCRLPPAYA